MKYVILILLLFGFGQLKAQSEKEKLIQKIISINELGDEMEGMTLEIPPDIPIEDIMPSAHDNYLYFQELKPLLTQSELQKFESCDTDIIRMFIWVDYLKNDSIKKDFFGAFKREFKIQRILLRIQGCEGADLYTYDILTDEMLERKSQSNFRYYYENVLNKIWIYALQKRKQLGHTFCSNLFKELHYDSSLIEDIAFQVLEYNSILALHYLLKNDKVNFEKIYRFYLSEVFPSKKYQYYELDQLYTIAEKLNDSNLKNLLRYKFLNIGEDFDKFEKDYQRLKQYRNL